MNEFTERSKADITLPYAVNDVCCILLPYRNVSRNHILGRNIDDQIGELIKIANTKKKDYSAATTKSLRASSVIFSDCFRLVCCRALRAACCLLTFIVVSVNRYVCGCSSLAGFCSVPESTVHPDENASWAE